MVLTETWLLRKWAPPSGAKFTPYLGYGSRENGFPTLQEKAFSNLRLQFLLLAVSIHQLVGPTTAADGRCVLTHPSLTRELILPRHHGYNALYIKLYTLFHLALNYLFCTF